MSIVFSGVSFEYGSGVRALSAIDLTIEQGAFLGVIGHTGSGKSTFAALCNGLLVPTTGTVTVDGENSADVACATHIRSHVGLVFQYPERQLFASSVIEDVAFAPRNAGVERAQADELARRALERVGLDAELFASKSPFELSGGQQRRVALAGVLAMNPDVLVLDEPTAGMDPAAAHALREDLVRLNAEGLTIILISHDMDAIAALSRHVIALEEGRILLQGSPEELFAPENAELLERSGLGLPQACACAQRLKRAGLGIPLPQTTLDALADAIAEQMSRR